MRDTAGTKSTFVHKKSLHQAVQGDFPWGDCGVNFIRFHPVSRIFSWSKMASRSLFAR